jgi:hypothetical protein
MHALFNTKKLKHMKAIFQNDYPGGKGETVESKRLDQHGKAWFQLDFYKIQYRPYSSKKRLRVKYLQLQFLIFLTGREKWQPDSAFLYIETMKAPTLN